MQQAHFNAVSMRYIKMVAATKAILAIFCNESYGSIGDTEMLAL